MSKCLYKNVFISMSFKRADTDSVTVSSTVHKHLNDLFRRDDVNYDELRKILNSGETHADLQSMQKVRLNSIYGEVRSKA